MFRYQKVIQEKKACIIKERSLHRVWVLSHERRNVELVSFRAFLVFKIVFGNINLALAHLKKRVQSQHSTHQNKSKALIEASLDSHWR